MRPLYSYQPLTSEADGLYHSPAAVPDGNLLVSRRPADGSAQHAVYLLDLTAKKATLVFDDPLYHDVQAKMVAPRTEPDGRSSSVIDTDPLGKLYCLNVYTPDQAGKVLLPAGAVKQVRVVEGVPGRAESGDEQGGADTRKVLRRSLGQAPVAADGSFNLQVPANIPLELQLLDERGVTLRTSGWVWTRNHFNQGCVGCHEDPELTPENYVVDALDIPSVTLAPDPPERRTVTFLRDVLPLAKTKCAPCHGTGGAAPQIAEELAAGDLRAFRAVCGMAAGTEAGVGQYVHPGQARTSPLAWHIFGVNTALDSDESAYGQPFKAIPADHAIQLTEEECRLLVEWIDLGAAFNSAQIWLIEKELQH